MLHKIGVFTATPVLTIVAITAFKTLKENVSSEWHFNKNAYQYKERKIDNGTITGGKRIEYYKSIDTTGSKDAFINNRWVKDSIWIYLSKTGDTIKKVQYKNGVEVK
jgi:hypothetical protein